MVQFAGVADVARLVARTGVDAVLLGLAAAIEADFRRRECFEKTPRLASHSPSGVIELMPISDGTHCDCPGKTELDPAVLRDAGVFVEFLDQARVEGEIQQLPADFPATELWRVLCGAAPGRRDDGEVTVFDSVGFALEDFSTLRFLRDLSARAGLSSALDLVPDLADPRGLFGLLAPGAALVPPEPASVLAPVPA